MPERYTRRPKQLGLPILGRDSGESFQILFEGPGWVLIQPSEGPTVLPHTHAQQGGPGGFRIG